MVSVVPINDCRGRPYCMDAGKNAKAGQKEPTQSAAADLLLFCGHRRVVLDSRHSVDSCR